MAESKTIGVLINEIREDFNIPPYVTDDALKRYVRESESFFSLLSPSCDYDSDLTYRELLKSRAYYAWQHALPDYETGYASMILTWLAQRTVYTADTEDSDNGNS